jgi:hypothetical protein
MKCFKIKCKEHHPDIATWISGILLGSLGSPAAIPLLSGTVSVDHLPTVNTGLLLEDRQSHMLSTLQFKEDTFKYIRVDNSVKDSPDSFKAAEPGFCDVLKRASVETRGETLWLTAERLDDTSSALLVLDAGRGNADYLDYEVSGCQVFQSLGGRNPVLLVALAPGQKITAVRSNWRWLNLFGFKLRKTIETIEVLYDGENIELTIKAAGRD